MSSMSPTRTATSRQTAWNSALPEMAAETKDRTRLRGGWPAPKVRRAKAVTSSGLVKSTVLVRALAAMSSEVYSANSVPSIVQPTEPSRPT